VNVSASNADGQNALLAIVPPAIVFRMCRLHVRPNNIVREAEVGGNGPDELGTKVTNEGTCDVGKAGNVYWKLQCWRGRAARTQ